LAFCKKKIICFLKKYTKGRKKSPNDHLILQLKFFNKIEHVELGAEGQRYRGKRNLPTQMQNSPTKVIRIKVFLEMVMIFRAVRTLLAT